MNFLGLKRQHALLLLYDPRIIYFWTGTVEARDREARSQCGCVATGFEELASKSEILFAGSCR